MLIFTYDSNGYFIKEVELNESDICPIEGKWLIPANATTKRPQIKNGYIKRFNGIEWDYEKVLTEEEKKVAGIIPLNEGEKVLNGEIILVTKPSKYYSWDFEKLLWFYDERIKQKEIDSIKFATENEILLLYPLWKQLNIIRAKDISPEALKVFNEMSEFIDYKRCMCDIEIENIK